MLALVLAAGAPVSANEIEDELYDFIFPSGGNGSQADPFRMNTVGDFVVLKEWMSGGITFKGYYFQMDKDVDFATSATVDDAGGNFVALGETPSKNYVPFSGTFDGQGHTISNLRVLRQYRVGQSGYGIADNAALFGYLKGATVRNVTLDTTCAFAAQRYEASIAGECEGSIISGCTSLARVYDIGVLSPTGGIVARVIGTDGAATTISDCRFGGSVEGSQYTGGIVGENLNDVSGLTITRCINEGTVTGVYRGLGGIMGYANMNTTISHCTNRGSVKSIDVTWNTSIITGGIVGHASNATVDHCTNEGFVKGDGGIVGTAENTSIIYCDNTADIEARGGIAYSLMYDSTIKHCSNSGSVLANIEMTAAIVLGAAPEALEDNYYTQDVEVHWGTDSNGKPIRVGGLVSRGYQSSSSMLTDVTAANGAVLREARITATAGADSYWATFYRACGNYAVDANTTVYTASKLPDIGGDSHGIATLVLTRVDDGIVPARVPVILRSSRPDITLTITDTTPTATADGTLTGYDGPPRNDTGTILRLTTDGTGAQMSRYDNAATPANEAYAAMGWWGGNTVAYRLQLDGQLLTGIATAATGISLTCNTQSMQVGQTLQLTATVWPEDAIDGGVTWTSSNEQVLTVSDNGLVTAVGTGRASISATCRDQTYADIFSLTASTTAISVTEPRVEVESIVIDGGDITLTYNTETNQGEQRQLSVTILPENAENKSINWATSASTLVSVSRRGVVTAHGITTEPVTITATASNGLQASIRVAVIDETMAGIHDVTADGCTPVRPRKVTEKGRLIIVTPDGRCYSIGGFKAMH